MRRLNDGAPTAAGRRGGVERPRASLADPPSISGPAASAWRPMTAAAIGAGVLGHLSSASEGLTGPAGELILIAHRLF